MCAGINSSAKAKIGSWITLAEWKYSEEKQKYIPFSVVTKQVDGIEIKEDVCCILIQGDEVTLCNLFSGHALKIKED